MIYERTHTRQIADYGGLAGLMPRYAAVFIIVTLASIGLPGLNGFVGEFLIIVGSFSTQPAAAVLAVVGVILSAIYMLWLVHRVFFGPPTVAISGGEEAGRVSRLIDLTRREWAVMLPVLAMIVMLGVYPQPFLKRIEPSVATLVNNYRQAVAPAETAQADMQTTINYEEDK
ncbi:NADH-quinone oxidoreductase subunit M [subsurface metagenome]